MLFRYIKVKKCPVNKLGSNRTFEGKKAPRIVLVNWQLFGHKCMITSYDGRSWETGFALSIGKDHFHI